MPNIKQQIISEHYSTIGKKGAKARWAKTDKEERHKIAMKMVEAKRKKLSPIIANQDLTT